MPILYWMAGLVLAWNIVPLLVLARLPVPWQVKLQAARSLLSAAGRGLGALLPDLLAPLVVPIALLGLSRDAERLPSWARWWDNDVSINGDQLEGAPVYYLPEFLRCFGDRRSFLARWWWLGLRNRASALSLALGHAYGPGEYQDAQHWGDPAVGRDHEGWTLNRRGPAWQLYVVHRLSDGLCFRLNYGFKVWANEGDKRPTAMVVNIAASVLRWRGAA